MSAAGVPGRPIRRSRPGAPRWRRRPESARRATAGPGRGAATAGTGGARSGPSGARPVTTPKYGARTPPGADGAPAPAPSTRAARGPPRPAAIRPRFARRRSIWPSVAFCAALRDSSPSRTWRHSMIAHHLRRGHDADAHPAVGDPLDQALGDEHVQGQPGAVAGHAVPLAQLGLDQPLSRDDGAARDLVPQSLLGDALALQASEQVCALAGHLSHRPTVSNANEMSQGQVPNPQGDVPRRGRTTCEGAARPRTSRPSASRRDHSKVVTVS